MHAELLDDADFEEAPEDPFLAFAFLEARARERMRAQIAPLDYNQGVEDYQLEYMTAVIAIAEHFKISPISEIALPNPQTFKSSDYARISQQITSRVYQIKAANAERSRQTSVALSSAERQKIQDKISKLRNLLNGSELDEKRKARLLAILADFEQELKKPRTNFSRFLHVGLILAALHGTAGVAEDATKLYDGAVKVLGIAKGHEEQKREPLQLPAPAKQLPAPKSTAVASGYGRSQEAFPADLDDEIPF